jgi:hypothetical protein
LRPCGQRGEAKGQKKDCPFHDGLFWNGCQSS